MKDKYKNTKTFLIATLGVLIVVPLAWWVFTRMEGQPPLVDYDDGVVEIGAEKTLHMQFQDAKSGLRRVWIGVIANGKESTLYEKNFPAAGFLRPGKQKAAAADVRVSTRELGLKDGPATLRLVVVDHSWRNWWKGNRTYLENEIVIDTQPPSIAVLTKAHNINPGGAGLVVYQLSEPCPESGVMVGENFFPAYPGRFKDPQTMTAIFALGHDQGNGAEIYVKAVDKAGNSSRQGFTHYIRKQRFKQDRIQISDRFLETKMPEFENDFESKPPTLLDQFLYVNQVLRRKNAETIRAQTRQSDPDLLWQGTFLRLPKSANRAGFADHRYYQYADRSVDDQVHLGIDLASLEHSPVPAANRGRVAFTGRIGIYGNTVIIDHGLSLFSMYAHLSRVDVAAGQMVEKGQEIGRTGTSGLAGGDHLHFGMLIHQTFVNPIEWWDAAWIQFNITDKLESIGG